MKPAPLDSGRLVGDRYILESLIAQGGMGEVWRARHKTLKSLVAIKFLHRASSFSQSTRKRFLTEAQVTANLKTRHAVQVFDFGVIDDGLPYLVMEYLEGQTLEKRIEGEGRLSIETTVMVLRQAARGLDRAHALGIVHRDFKPENIIILADEEGGEHVKVVDFGIAKILGDLAELVPPSSSGEPMEGSGMVTNTAVGTPYYMAPEQVQDSSQVGPSADIWAFGVVAYECLTGRRPFDDVSIPMLLARLVTGERPVPASKRVPLPTAFDDWFDVACAHNPQDRFPDAYGAVAALAIALDVPGVPATISRTSVPGSPPALQRRVVSPLAATLDARKSARPPKLSSSEALLEPSPAPPPSERIDVTPPSLPLARAALPPPPLGPPPQTASAPQPPGDRKDQTYAPVEPAPRTPRVGRPPRVPQSLLVIGGIVALAAITIAIARRPAVPVAAASVASAVVLASTSPSVEPSGAPAAEPAPPEASASSASLIAASMSAAPSAPAANFPAATLRVPATKKSAAPVKSAPSAFKLPPLGL